LGLVAFVIFSGLWDLLSMNNPGHPRNSAPQITKILMPSIKGLSQGEMVEIGLAFPTDYT
jgi:hypothetical protein